MSLPNEESPGDNRGPSEENEHPPNENQYIACGKRTPAEVVTHQAVTR